MGYKVSVLLSVYENESYIERCVSSLFGQTYSNLEYIIVDDCSPDNSMAELEGVMKEFPERAASVAIIHNERNKGLAAVRNIALDHATGEFVCVVDGDDWMEPDGIERMVEKQVATDADVVWGRALAHTKDEEIELSEPDYKDLEEWRMCYFRFTLGFVMVNWRRIIRRSLIEQHHIRHEEGLHIGNDKQFMPLVAYYAQSFSSVDAIVYHYERRNPKSRTFKAMNGVYEVFAYTREVESLRRVIRFLSDKEPRYLEAAERELLKRLLEYRAKAIQNGSREGFQIMVKWIKEVPAQYRDSIGWSNTIKTSLKMNYTVSRLCYLSKAMMRKAKVHFR